MTPETIRQAIYDKIEATWATATTISWSNRVFNPPITQNWIRPTIRMADTAYGELGRGSDSGVGIRTGMLILQIFTPLNSGSKNGYTWASTFETAFRRQTIEGVIFDEPWTNEVGPDAGRARVDGTSTGYFQINVYMPFHAFVGE